MNRGIALALATLGSLYLISSYTVAQNESSTDTSPLMASDTAHPADTVTIVSATPSPGTKLPRGSPVSIDIDLEYTLASLDAAHLVVSVGEIKATPPNCSKAAGGELSDAAGIDIQRGTAQIKLTVVWSGDTGQATKGRVYGTGYIAFFPSIWTAVSHRTRFKYFGMAPGYCYPFGS
jgi:hypothetical protein